MRTNKILYSINVGDVQNVAEEIEFKKLTQEELEFADRYIGDYIDWYGAIEQFLSDLPEIMEKEKSKEQACEMVE